LFWNTRQGIIMKVFLISNQQEIMEQPSSPCL
jgi:hypothetical protein